MKYPEERDRFGREKVKHPYYMQLKVVLLTIFFFLAVIPVLLCQEGKEALLFITTEPLGAGVRIDGEPLPQATPLLLRDLLPGPHRVEFTKKGFESAGITIDLESGETSSIDVALDARYFSPSFPARNDIIYNGTDLYEGWDQFKFPNGSYRIEQKGDYLYIDPIYPKQGIVTGLHIAVPLSLLMSGILTAGDLFYERSSTRLFSPGTITSYAVSAGVVSLDIIFSLGKRRFLRNRRIDPIPLESAPQVAQEYYTRAEGFLSLGRLTEALRDYSFIVQHHNDSAYFPLALYKIAKIHNITGEYALAASELNLILTDYPLPDLYDKTCKNLADLYVRTEQFQKGIDQLDRMVFYDPLYSKEDIDRYRADILEVWYGSDESVLPRLISSYVTMVTAYADSAQTNFYQYKTAFYLQQAGRGDAALKILNTISTADQSLSKLIEALKERIQGKEGR